MKKKFREEYDSMLTAPCQQLYELWKKAGLIKGKKISESSRALETRVAMLEEKPDNSSNEGFYSHEMPNSNNRNNPALHKGTRQSQANIWWLGLLKGDSQPSVLNDRFIKPLNTIHVMVAHAWVASSKPSLESVHMQTHV